MAIPYEGMMAAGQWDFDGSCAPKEDGSDSREWNQEFFTLGIFQVEGKARGKQLKRGKVQLRVKGMVNKPGATYAVARDICKKLNSGESQAAEFGKTIKSF